MKKSQIIDKKIKFLFFKIIFRLIGDLKTSQFDNKGSIYRSGSNSTNLYKKFSLDNAMAYESVNLRYSFLNDRHVKYISPASTPTSPKHLRYFFKKNTPPEIPLINIPSMIQTNKNSIVQPLSLNDNSDSYRRSISSQDFTSETKRSSLLHFKPIVNSSYPFKRCFSAKNYLPLRKSMTTSHNLFEINTTVSSPISNNSLKRLPIFTHFSPNSTTMSRCPSCHHFSISSPLTTIPKLIDTETIGRIQKACGLLPTDFLPIQSRLSRNSTTPELASIDSGYSHSNSLASNPLKPSLWRTNNPNTNIDSEYSEILKTMKDLLNSVLKNCS